MESRKIFLLSLVVFWCFTFGFSFSQILALGSAPKITITKEAEAETSVKGIPGYLGFETIADIVEEVGPAVVNIDIVKKITLRSPFEDFEKEFGFFGLEPFPEFKEFFKERTVPQKGAGSGFIIDKKGYVLTNEHVVKGADEIKVTLKDGRKFTGKVSGSDATLDLAVVKIEARDLPVLTLGDSAKIRVGEWVIAIGNPYGFANTVTTGIISATGRSLEDIGKRNLIQVDAPINPGNSGGPLLNMKGEVVGINVAIVAGAQGIGFAIPIKAAQEVLGELVKKGKVIRPWLGVYMRDVDEKIAAYLDLPLAEGVVVTEVAKDSPAEKMGLKKYDVLREINGEKIKSGNEIQKTIQNLKVGDRITLKVYREGKSETFSARLAERP